MFTSHVSEIEMSKPKTYILFLNLFFIGCLAQDSCHIQGRCYNLNITMTDTYFDCQDACLTYDNCNYFTHEQTGDLCQLWSNCTNILSSLCPTCYTGEKYCPQVICDQHGMCQGEVVGESYTQTLQECLDKCVNQDGCNWYSYSDSVNLCLLTSNCDPNTAEGSVGTFINGYVLVCGGKIDSQQCFCYDIDIEAKPSSSIP